MEQLTATRPILYMGRMYQIGEPLPGCDPNMTQAWLRAGSAIWKALEKKREQVSSQAAGADVSNSNTIPMREKLEDSTKDELLELAEALGVPIPRGATKALLVELIANSQLGEAEDGGEP